jgi:hypothetical protein
MTVDIITVGKRSIYNPAHYQIKELYKDKNWLLIDLMFTWDLPKAINELQQQRLKHYDRIFIDGVGWKNLGNDPVLDRAEISQTPYEQDEDYQVTKITSGCPHNCAFCFSDDFKVAGVPTFNRNKVLLVDENILSHPHIIDVLDKLKNVRVGGRVVHFEAICGFEKGRITLDTAQALRLARFDSPRIAWDGGGEEEGDVLAAIENLTTSGYKAKDISVFVITNYKQSYGDCVKKLDILHNRGVKINDCCYNCTYSHPIPEYWCMDEIKTFRRQARKHNQLIVFNGYDPEQ